MSRVAVYCSPYKVAETSISNLMLPPFAMLTNQAKVAIFHSWERVIILLRRDYFCSGDIIHVRTPTHRLAAPHTNSRAHSQAQTNAERRSSLHRVLSLD